MDKTDNQAIGTRLAMIRKANNYTQEQLAAALDLTTKHISHCESGTSFLSLNKLISFCELFDCSIDYIIWGKTKDADIEKLNKSVLNLLHTGSPQDITILNRYLDVFCELLSIQSK